MVKVIDRKILVLSLKMSYLFELEVN